MSDLVARLREAEAYRIEDPVHLRLRAALNPPGCCPHCNHGPGFVHHAGCDAGCMG